MSKGTDGSDQAGKQPDIWDVLQRSAEALPPAPKAEEDSKPKPADDEETKEQQKRKRTRIRRTLDLISLAAWLYLVTQILGIDLIEMLLERR